MEKKWRGICEFEMNFKKHFFFVGVLILAMMTLNFLEARSENRCQKWLCLLWNKVRIWRTGPGIPNSYHEFPGVPPSPPPPPRGLGAEDFAWVPLYSNVRCFTVTPKNYRLALYKNCGKPSSPSLYHKHKIRSKIDTEGVGTMLALRLY